LPVRSSASSAQSTLSFDHRPAGGLGERPPRSFFSRLLEPGHILARWVKVNWLFWTALLQWLWVTFGLRLDLRGSDPRPRILRQFLERAGGTWIKLGQILAMRSDFLPPDMVDELSKLLDNVPPFSFEIAKKTAEADLGRRLEEIFADFPSVPIASASFGQVYRAVLRTGEEVAVKIMRPGLETIIRSDLVQLRILAFVIDTFQFFGSIRLANLVDQLEKILHEEIDYHFEAENIRRAVETSRYVPIMKIPRVIEGLCTYRVLTMEFLEGIWMNEILAAIRDNDEGKLQEFYNRGLQRKVVAQRIFFIGMRQLFEIGRFHADPHAANIVILRDNVVGYVDFGIVGQMDEELAESQSHYLQALKDGRINDAARALSESVVVPEKYQHRLPEFRARLADQVGDWVVRVNNPHAMLRRKSIAQLLLDNIQLIREYGFELMDNTMRYYRALIISDVIVLQVDPDFDTVRSLRRYYRNRQVRQLRTELTLNNVTWTAAEYFDLWLAGPRILTQLSSFLRRNEESYGVAVAQYTGLWRGLANGSFILLLAVLVARLLGYPDVAAIIKFPVSLNWRWFAPLLLLCWRITRLLAR
jgi:ubiquinone biosynthesis protein